MRVLLASWLAIALVATVSVAQTGSEDPVAGPGEGPAAAPAFIADLQIQELGTPSSLRLRVFYQPGLAPIPPTAGQLLMVFADGALGNDAFFVPTDLAIEVGESQVYRVEFEQASDMFGQILGGSLQAGDSRLGFIMLPSQLRLGEHFPDRPESIVARYAHHRAGFRRATDEETREWRRSIDVPRLMHALNIWWEWLGEIDKASAMNEGEARFFAERIFPGQGHILINSSLDPTGLRNAIFRVGERKLLTSPVTQRVAPAYPVAARQAGAEGLVVVLAYISERGRVQDASVLASNTVHLLNTAALRAAMQWRFTPPEDDQGNPTDGWRLLPFQFQLDRAPVAGASGTPSAPVQAGFVPPRILKQVDPKYPEKARRSRIEGTVVYRATISESGRLVEALLLEPVHPLLDEAALAALEQSLFEPARRDGKPVEAELRVKYPFPRKREP